MLDELQLQAQMDLMNQYQALQDPAYRAKQKSLYEEKAGDINAAQAFANLGDVFAGQKVGSTAPYFQNVQSELKKDILTGEDTQRKNILDAYLKSKYAENLGTALQNKLATADITQKNKEADRALREKQVNIQEKALGLKGQALGMKSEKEENLNAAQAKQLGLAEMGNLANKQYQEAISAGFDPTAYKNLADFSDSVPQFAKSDLGKKAMAAQKAWVESYLRDASGAAIAASERSAYANDYFPRPGDTPEIVANKNALRAQKEKAALIGAGKGAKKFPEQIKPSEKQETKIINGQTYKKSQGGWQKVSP
jgi:hypothetical protein